MCLQAVLKAMCLQAMLKAVQCINLQKHALMVLFAHVQFSAAIFSAGDARSWLMMHASRMPAMQARWTPPHAS